MTGGEAQQHGQTLARWVEKVMDGGNGQQYDQIQARQAEKAITKVQQS
jgi:hypothetical protein